MESILVILDTDENGGLARPARETLEAARGLMAGGAGGELVCGLIGAKADDAAGVARGAGATRVLAVAGEAFQSPRYSTDAAAAAAIVKEANAAVVLAPCTSRMIRALPGVAKRTGAAVDTHIVGLALDNGALTANRWYYRQRMEARFMRSARPWMLLLEPGAFPAWQGEPGASDFTSIEVTLERTHQRTTVLGTESPKGEQQTIRPDANLLLVAGAGWTKKQKDGETHTTEAGELILNFVQRTQCSLGSSKSLVDLKSEGGAVLPFLTHLHQVGQTGTTPRHAKGLATCCHGEEPHVVGWRFIHERRAVNLDPNCGWARGKADVVYVADAFAVMRELNALIGNK